MFQTTSTLAIGILALSGLAGCGSEAPSTTVRVPLAEVTSTMAYPAIWENFQALTQIPRVSHHEAQVSAFVADFGRSLALDTTVNDVGNVIIRKPATPGMESRPGVVLQGHLDMVAQKTAASTHNFDTDPIDAYVLDGWVYADGTTLGADDGIGVATIMALLQAKDIAHGPLDALFTVDEEDAFTGINALSPDDLAGRKLINLDDELEGEVVVSSAGGVDVDVSDAYAEAATPAGMTAFQVVVDGLLGGHSGMDIDKGRGSAHQLMSRLLVKATVSLDVRVASLTGGNQSNAIARTTSVVVAVPTNQAAAFGVYVKEFAATVAGELTATDPGVTVTATPVAMPANVMEPSAQAALIGAVYEAPQGVYAMSTEVPGVVETSGNIGVLSIGAGQFVATVCVRSAVDLERDAEARRFAKVFEDAGATVRTVGAYASWPLNPNSVLLATMKHAYLGLYGVEPAVVALHVGLETSIAGVKYPGMDMISIGPTAQGGHSPDERQEVASVPKVYDQVVAVLKAIQ